MRCDYVAGTVQVKTLWIGAVATGKLLLVDTFLDCLDHSMDSADDDLGLINDDHMRPVLCNDLIAVMRQR